MVEFSQKVLSPTLFANMGDFFIQKSGLTAETSGMISNLNSSIEKALQLTTCVAGLVLI
jgi:hypothetical protein